MSDPEPTTKLCGLCGEVKRLEDEFYRRRGAKNGRRSNCKACMNRYGEAWREAHPEKISVYNATSYAMNKDGIAAYKAAYRATYPRRHKARKAVSHALAAGRLTRQPCNRCGLDPKIINGRNRIQGHHHHGYAEAQWLDVEWLCTRCHGAVHRACDEAQTELSHD